MTRFTAQSLAAFAAIVITATSFATLVNVPAAHALTAMPVLA